MMQQRTLSINSNTINYYISDSEFKHNTTLILLHGNSLSGKIFTHQFNGNLKNQVNLLAIDFPGHGNSSNAKDPRDDYHLMAFAQLIDQFILTLNIKRPVFFGHSLGGHVLNQLLYFNKNISGVILCGTPPINPAVDLLIYMKAPSLEDDYSMAWLTHPATVFLGKPEWSNEELQIFYQSLWGEDEITSKEIMSDIKRTDGIFREILIAEIIKKNFYDEIDLLRQLKMPIAMIHGAKDKLVNLKYLERLPLNFWQDKIHIIETAGHMPFYEQPEKFDEMVMKYISLL